MLIYSNMLIRTADGNLIQVNRYDFKNDAMFYQKIMDLKRAFTKSK